MSAPKQTIVGFHQDEAGVWVSRLSYGHTQHVRHDPPWQNRSWVETPAGREAFMGCRLMCPACGEEETSS